MCDKNVRLSCISKLTFLENYDTAVHMHDIKQLQGYGIP